MGCPDHAGRLTTPRSFGHALHSNLPLTSNASTTVACPARSPRSTWTPPTAGRSPAIGSMSPTPASSPAGGSISPFRTASPGRRTTTISASSTRWTVSISSRACRSRSAARSTRHGHQQYTSFRSSWRTRLRPTRAAACGSGSIRRVWDVATNMLHVESDALLSSNTPATRWSSRAACTTRTGGRSSRAASSRASATHGISGRRKTRPSRSTGRTPPGPCGRSGAGCGKTS